LNKEVARILPKKKEIIFKNGEKVSFDILISTIPLNELLKKMERKPGEVGKTAAKLLWNGGYMVGIGIKKPCPSKKNWMYFPQDDSPFYRVTYLSNYSPNMTPKGDYFSFLTESSYSKYKAVSRDTVIEETIQGLVNSKLISEEDRSLIVSTYMLDAPYSFPVPFLGRDKVLREIQSFLMKNGIFSRGRFGGWKYEVGNMDHSVMQGIEVVDRILLGKEETVYKS
jgi:protoporphyrinogen oxidase